MYSNFNQRKEKKPMNNNPCAHNITDQSSLSITSIKPHSTSSRTLAAKDTPSLIARALMLACVSGSNRQTVLSIFPSRRPFAGFLHALSIDHKPFGGFIRLPHLKQTFLRCRFIALHFGHSFPVLIASFFSLSAFDGYV